VRARSPRARAAGPGGLAAAGRSARDRRAEGGRRGLRPAETPGL